MTWLGIKPETLGMQSRGSSELIEVFLKKTDIPPLWIFSFSTAVILKIRSRSPKSIQFFVMSQNIYPWKFGKNPTTGSQEMCRQESVTPMSMGSALKTIYPPPHRWGYIMCYCGGCIYLTHTVQIFMLAWVFADFASSWSTVPTFFLAKM